MDHSRYRAFRSGESEGGGYAYSPYPPRHPNGAVMGRLLMATDSPRLGKANRQHMSKSGPFSTILVRFGHETL